MYYCCYYYTTTTTLLLLYYYYYYNNYSIITITFAAKTLMPYIFSCNKNTYFY